MPQPAEIVLILALAWMIYTYFGYPALLALLKRGERPRSGEAPEPAVTVLIAAFNEADVIEETVNNKLLADYPPEKLDILVVSDGSTDGTDEIVEAIAREHPDRVGLVRQEPRAGKTSGLNLVVQQARGEILIFADANSIYEEQSVRELAATFADESVGYVTGKMIYTNPDGSVTGDGCTTYMRYENALRDLETRVGSVVGVDGGIDAVRRSLYQPMRADQLPDFVLPLKVVEQGYRVAYQPRAILRESAVTSADQEYRMRVRVTLRAMWALWDLRGLFNPFRYPVFSWQLWSHKLMRYFAFVPQIAVFVCNVLLVGRHPAYLWLLAAQVAFYGMAGLGYLSSRADRPIAGATIAYYFTLLNLACLHAASKFVRGQKIVLWQPRSG